jgi:DNA topoisomerase-1
VSRLPKTLVIVESPAKARTISKFLGRNYTVKASMGHVRDLPRSQFGVDLKNHFSPKYITVRGQGKVLQELREAVKKSDLVLLATDPDREGEAISWHLSKALNLPVDTTRRIEFHEITKPAIQRAVKNPRDLNMHLVDAQQARRVLDRIVGYKLSPLLWSKVKKGLSAGRVQSVALRLICDREEEIESFIPKEYWLISASFITAEGHEFTAKLHSYEEKDLELNNERQAQKVLTDLEGASYIVKSISVKQRKRNPAPPFTTSTLQQEASRRMGFSAQKTMSLAQALYEGKDLGSEGSVGLITYLRTDSTHISQEAQNEAKEYILQAYGKEYLPESPRKYTNPKRAQAAHEGIRPTSIHRRPEEVKEFLKRDEYRLYKLIWERFLASQMAPAQIQTMTVDIKAGDYCFRATGSTVMFPGFMSIYIEQEDEENALSREEILPGLVKNEEVTCEKLTPSQHFTQPPARFSEAMLVKLLEELGIGRPSTYVSIVETIQKRGYVVKEEKRFHPTELGRIINEILKEHFPDIVDVDFTAKLEANLDSIEEGDKQWTKVIEEFYPSFEQALNKAQKLVEEVEIVDEVSDEVCELCGRQMVIKWGRYGRFLACPGFPDCRNTKPLNQTIDVPCPKCGHQIVERRSKKGRTFYGCEKYPECDFTSWQKPVKQPCPVCGGLMVEKKGKNQIAWVCQNKECGHKLSPDNQDGN